jgi:hypothetical protein
MTSPAAHTSQAADLNRAPVTPGTNAVAADTHDKPAAARNETSNVCGGGYLSLALQVADVEKRVGDLSDLCGFMLATLRVNLLRGTLTAADNAEFERLLNGWHRRWIGIEGGKLQPEHRDEIGKRLKWDGKTYLGHDCPEFEEGAL